MKKFLLMLSLATAILVGFSGCSKDKDNDFSKLDPNKEYCWVFTSKVTIMGQTVSADTPKQCGFTVAEAEEIRKTAEDAVQVPGATITVTKKVVD